MEHQEADMWQAADRGTARDDTARFLRELRQLRDGAGLGYAELAARAHYPYDAIKAAETGPSLPDLPVLSAYVRGCGGTAEEWEERWRALTRTPCLPVPALREAGNSPAATAGARISAATGVVDTPDPSLIMAALSRVAEGMAGGSDVAAPLIVPPRPPCPGDAPAGGGPVPGLPAADVPPVAFSPFGSATPAAEPHLVPADAPAAAQPAARAEDSLATVASDSPATAADEPAAAASAAGAETVGRPRGWDPIRVSSAWPVLGNKDTRQAEVSGDTAGTGTAGPADTQRPGPGASSGSGTRPVVRQSAWSGRPNTPGETASAARPGSRARALIVAVVLVCVLAVVLAVFA